MKVVVLAGPGTWEGPTATPHLLMRWQWDHSARGVADEGVKGQLLDGIVSALCQRVGSRTRDKPTLGATTRAEHPRPITLPLLLRQSPATVSLAVFFTAVSAVLISQQKLCFSFRKILKMTLGDATFVLAGWRWCGGGGGGGLIDISILHN